MATSGTYTDQLTNLQIISAALRKVNRLGDHETLGDTDTRYTNSLIALKLILKEFATSGMPLWAVEEATIAFSNFTTASGITIGLSGQTVTQVAPLKIVGAFRRDSVTATDPVDTPMTVYEQDTYNTIPNKSTTGTPNFYTYYPDGAGSANAATGTLKVWPLPDTYWTTNGSIVIRYQRPMQDAGTSAQNIEFPQEWHRAVVYALAYDIAPEYGLDINQRDRLMRDRDMIVAQAHSFGTEEGSFFFQPKKR